MNDMRCAFIATRFIVFFIVLIIANIECVQSSEQTMDGLGTSIQNRPSLEEVDIYLNSIGYTCKGGGSLSFSNDDPGRILEKEIEEGEEDQFFYIKNGLLAFVCVVVAALAAGLTMGLVSQELLDLKIKEIAGNTDEKKQARSVIPLLSDHHRLLVTLLLINAMANEALPLFLDKLVPGYVAVILSVTLVLFFGEIIPSAIFSGPNKLAISSKLAPVVKFLLWILCPLAWPIAKVLDKVLHEEGDDNGALQKYDRGELSALVRLQYEERKEAKLRKKQHRALAGLDLSNSNNKSDEGSVRFVKDIDTVNIVQGALSLQIKTAGDIMVPMKDVYSVSKDMVLDERNTLKIYRRGFSRVPVYESPSKSAIAGIFTTRQLMVLNAHEERQLSTLPLVQPHCIEPQMNILSLVNLFQEGKSSANKGGHLALVCHDPNIATLSQESGVAIPESAGVIGIVTLENCIEALIKEDIYDEYDQAEKRSMQRARWAANKWRAFTEKKRHAKQSVSDEEEGLLHEGSALLPS